MTKTDENFYKAYVGEAKASIRLLGYAEKADKEEYPQVAKLFRAIAAAERVHAIKHLRQMKVIRSTEENLEVSFESETSISEDIYPGLIEQAIEDGNKAAEIGFSQARDAEAVHAGLYKKSIGHMVAEEETTYYVCAVCGFVVDAVVPDECPVCGAPKEKFFAVD